MEQAIKTAKAGLFNKPNASSINKSRILTGLPLAGAGVWGRKKEKIPSKTEEIPPR
jgi:hypothetical protein